MTGFIYILKSLKNNTFYIGRTGNLRQRLIEHENGNSKYTSEILPIKLVFSQEFETIKLARQIEYKLKQLKNKKVIEKIVFKGMLFINKQGNINW